MVIETMILYTCVAALLSGAFIIGLIFLYSVVEEKEKQKRNKLKWQITICPYNITIKPNKGKYKKDTKEEEKITNEIIRLRAETTVERKWDDQQRKDQIYDALCELRAIVEKETYEKY